jgi:hypothetical protein
MAAGKNSNAIFYSISNGKIVRQFQNKTADSVERVNKNGKTVHEEFYDYLDGVIANIETKENEYGKFWYVTLDDAGVNQVLQFNYSSGYANGFLKALPNVDLSQKVKLIPSSKKEGDKTKTTLFINQHGNAIKWAYTKESPNGIPELKQIKRKGKTEWDDSEIMEFLEKMVNTEILPKLKSFKEVAHEVEEDNEPAPF